ncbi:ATP/GTP-binding protein [Streptomyces sp. CB02959]|uniref:ABC1 kinase family protein n=1 Tax=Streptomyces sp. CB02959 TaxID=2020330 RepID=UPI000C27864E|nr:AarF/UbiB family protein [Streptomyces sp. CB02959]PJN32302.1 ATP/GTP-binding protein [Streptomyces sp. CB02959]
MRGRGRYVVGRMGRLAFREVRRELALRRGRTTHAMAGYERAQAVRQVLEDLGPFWIKIGQILSTRPDIVPQAVIDELEQLHDRITPEPFAPFETVIEGDLGPDWRDRFADIDTSRPLGAASLAQTYRATMADETPAVVKIQRPMTREVVTADMGLLRRLARTVTRHAPRFSAVVDIEAMLGVIFDAMEPELDFTLEAANMERARTCAAEFEHLSIPDVILATEHVLIQSLAPGRSIRDIKPDECTDEERTAIGEDLLAFMYKGFFTDRFFHADPHPGNIFVEPGQGATIIDWGMTGRLDRSLSSTLLLLFFQLANNDGTAVARTWTSLGHPTPWAQPTAFADDMANFVPKIATASLDELNFGVSLTAILQHSTKRGIRVNPAIAILGKAFANIEGSLRCLCPELVITQILQDEIQEIIFTLAHELMSEKQAACTALEIMHAAPTGIRKLQGLLDSLTSNEFTLRITENKDPQTLLAEQAAARSRNRRRALLAAAAYTLWKLTDNHRRRRC